MTRIAATVFIFLVAAGASAQNGAKVAASPGVRAEVPAASAAPASANRPQDRKRSQPPGTAAQTPRGKDGDLSSEDARRMQAKMDAQARSSTAVSKVLKKSADTSDAATSNMK